MHPGRPWKPSLSERKRESVAAGLARRDGRGDAPRGTDGKTVSLIRPSDSAARDSFLQVVQQGHCTLPRPGPVFAPCRTRGRLPPSFSSESTSLVREQPKNEYGRRLPERRRWDWGTHMAAALRRHDISDLLRVASEQQRHQTLGGQSSSRAFAAETTAMATCNCVRREFSCNIW